MGGTENVATGVGDSSSCRASCPAELYESRGMTPYDVLMDVHALYWIAEGAGGVIVSVFRILHVFLFCWVGKGRRHPGAP